MNSRHRILAGRALSGLYAIADSADIEAVLRGGCRIIQYRNKTASELERQQTCRDLRRLCDNYDALLLVNDDVELALAVGADGVHLGQSDLDMTAARQRLGDNAIIGISCHNSLALAMAAEQQGASYVAFGRFFDSHTKPDAPAAELSLLSQAKQQLRIPIVAIGGITRDNAPAVIAEGADMIAVIHELFSASDARDREARARTFCQLFATN